MPALSATPMFRNSGETWGTLRRCNSLITLRLLPVTPITPAGENYHCPVLLACDNEERNHVSPQYASYVLPTEVGLCL